MALVKEFNTDMGVSIEYHKISNFSMQHIGSGYYDVHVVVSSYINEELRREYPNSKTKSKAYFLKVTLNELETTPVLKLLYSKLKETDDFKDATNA